MKNQNCKYLDKFGFDHSCPSVWVEVADSRHEIWKKQRKDYGFDERDTWNMDFTIAAFLYSHLKMYKEFSILDQSTHEYTYMDIDLTAENLIDMAIDYLEIYLWYIKMDWSAELSVPRDQREYVFQAALNIIGAIGTHLWW